MSLYRDTGVVLRVQKLGEEIRFRSSLPSKLNEMAILITARFWTSQYEWYAHCKLALAAGLERLDLALQGWDS